MMNFDEFCKGSFTKWNGEPSEGVKTWDRERGRFVDPFIMNNEDDILRPKYYGARGCGKSAFMTEAMLNYIKNDIESTKNINQIINKGENTMPVNYNDLFISSRVYMANVFLPKIKDVKFNPPATIVLWDDKTKTVVKTQNGEPYDPEKGLAMCIVKKVYGNKGRYFNNISKWVDAYYEKLAKEVPPAVIDEPTTVRKIFFATREGAEKMLSRIIEIRDTYGYVTMADVCDLLGVNTCHEDNKFGWTSLRGSSIKKNDNGYFLYLTKTNWTKE